MRIERFTTMATENIYLLTDPAEKRAVIIDPGAPSPSLEDRVRDEGLTIEGILLTHGHADHFGGADHYRTLYGAPIWASEKEKDLLLDPEMNVSLAFMGRAMSLTCDHYFKEGDRVTSFDLEVLETPGHTGGSVCFRGQNFLFTGDTLFQGSCGRWDLPTGGMHTLFRSLGRLFRLEGDYWILPGHGPETRLSIEKATSPIMDYVIMQEDRDRKQGKEKES